MNKNNLNIKLNETQIKIFNTLLTFRKQLGLSTVMRVAGGWVRDKIMGKESHDIDIALDDMKGEEFVVMLKKHSETKQQKISGFGVTKFNPQLSKHLETATAKICGLSIDFVNLRSESYNETSRIPIIENGTPQSDALRRDFTINSLFYNINTEEVEDFSNRGITDLENKILRTPLCKQICYKEPLITFKDDPLRILRCFRFKSRFGFKIDQIIYKAIQNQQVHEALRTKVSKQRIGIQLQGILKAPFPKLAFQEILRYHYWNIIFEVPQQSDLYPKKELISKIPEISYFIYQRGLLSFEENKFYSKNSLTVKQQIKMKKKKIQYSEQQLNILISLVLLTAVYRQFKVQIGKNSVGLIEHIVKNQLKYPSKWAKFAHKSGQLLLELEQLLKKQQQNKQKFKISVIRWLKSAEEKWQIIIHIFNAILQYQQNKNLSIKPLQLRQFIYDQKLDETYMVQSFIDGNFLIKIGKKGPIIKQILQNTIIWRVLNPEEEKDLFLEMFEKNIEFFENENSYK